MGTDPVSNVVVKDFLPTGSRFIAAADTAPGLGGVLLQPRRLADRRHRHVHRR